MRTDSEEGPHTINTGMLKNIWRELRAPEQKRHSFQGVMNHERNCELEDMMKRLTSWVQLQHWRHRLMSAQTFLRKKRFDRMWPISNSLYFL